MTRKDINLIAEAYSSNKLTPQQEHRYSILRDFGWEYDYTTSKGSLVMNRMDRGTEHTTKLAVGVITPDGEFTRLKQNEDPDNF